MRKFEYRVVDPNERAEARPVDERGAIAILNELGSEGWELVWMHNIMRPNEEWVFKREVQGG